MYSQKAAKVRILMLHGYAQSGAFFTTKTRPLVAELRKSLSYTYNVSEDEIAFVFPTAPHPLVVPEKWNNDVGSAGHFLTVEKPEVDYWAWGYHPNRGSRYPGLDDTFRILASLVEEHGPFQGVVGFSQGAALAALFSSWCESGSTPGRAEGLADLASTDPEVAAAVATGPPQGPLDFVLCFSGFRISMDCYSGFYEPPIQTPCTHIIGTLDTVVDEQQSIDFVSTFANKATIHHFGVHFVPTSQHILEQVGDSVQNSIMKGPMGFVQDPSPTIHPNQAALMTKLSWRDQESILLTGSNILVPISPSVSSTSENSFGLPEMPHRKTRKYRRIRIVRSYHMRILR